jgi:hypothetical protein
MASVHHSRPLRRRLRWEPTAGTSSFGCAIACSVCGILQLGSRRLANTWTTTTPQIHTSWKPGTSGLRGAVDSFKESPPGTAGALEVTGTETLPPQESTLATLQISPALRISSRTTSTRTPAQDTSRRVPADKVKQMLREIAFVLHATRVVGRLRDEGDEADATPPACKPGDRTVAGHQAYHR